MTQGNFFRNNDKNVFMRTEHTHDAAFKNKNGGLVKLLQFIKIKMFEMEIINDLEKNLEYF